MFIYYAITMIYAKKKKKNTKNLLYYGTVKWQNMLHGDKTLFNVTIWL